MPDQKTKKTLEVTLVHNETWTHGFVEIDGDLTEDATLLTERALQAFRERGTDEGAFVTDSEGDVVKAKFGISVKGHHIEFDSLVRGVKTPRWRTVVWNWDDGCEMPIVLNFMQDVDWA